MNEAMFDEDYVLTYLSDELYDFVLDVLAGRQKADIKFTKSKIIDMYVNYRFCNKTGKFDGSFEQYVYAMYRSRFLESFKLALVRGDCTVEDGI